MGGGDDNTMLPVEEGATGREPGSEEMEVRSTDLEEVEASDAVRMMLDDSPVIDEDGWFSEDEGVAGTEGTEEEAVLGEGSGGVGSEVMVGCDDGDEVKGDGVGERKSGEENSGELIARLVVSG